MKVLYLSPEDPRKHPELWSGLALHMLEAMESHGHTVEVMTPPLPWSHYVTALKWHWYHRVKKQTYLNQFDWLNQRVIGRRMTKMIERKDCDVVFSWATWMLAMIRTSRPRVMWYGTTFQQTIDLYYPDICNESRRAGIRVDREAIRGVAAAAFASHWARSSAINDYGAEPAKMHVVPYGANIDAPPIADVEQAVAARMPTFAKPLRLLFVGVEWARKGGDTAVAVVRELNRRGIESKLTVVGIENPPIDPTDRLLIDIVGRLDKNDPTQRRRLDELYASHHFFLMPSRGETFGVVYCEAIAHGLPCIGINTGGVGEIIRNGVSGMLFEPAENTKIPADSAAKAQATENAESRGFSLAPSRGIASADLVTSIADYLQQRSIAPEAYLALCRSSRELFDSTFNWTVAAARFNDILLRTAGVRS